MKKRDFLIMGVFFIAWTIVVAIMFMRTPGLLWFALAVAGSIAAGICLDRYIGMRRLEEEKLKGRKCRKCDQRKTTMALEFGEDEGLCRECLDEIIPLLTKQQG